jgi:class 3 adenylate cyclase
MASFDEVSDALECALAIREGFRARNETSSTLLRVRIGLAAGEPVDRDGDLFGPTVNLASRLCAASDPDSVLVSEGVHEVGSSKGFAFTEVDRRSLKGFARPVRAFECHGATSEGKN